MKDQELDSDFRNSQNSKNEDSLENIRIKNIIKKFRQFNAIENDRTLYSKTIFEPKMKSKLLSKNFNIPFIKKY